MSPRISIRLLAAQSDERLVALAAQGHERAFEALVLRYRNPLLRYCRRMGLSDARAEDVLQHALLKAWLALVRGSQVRELRPWLYRIVHNAAVSSLRRSPERDRELTDAVAASAGSRTSELDGALAVREALSGVAALPQMQRDAIVLSAIDGQSHNEVASALGITDGAVRGLLHRARTTLRSAAAAITPHSLIGLASRGTGAGGPGAERLAELSGAGGGVGVAGVLLKGAVLAATAGVLAAGATVGHAHRHGSRASKLATPSSRALGARAGAPGVTPASSAGLAGLQAPHDSLAVERLRLRHGAQHPRSRSVRDGAPEHRVPGGSSPGLSQRRQDDSPGVAQGENHGGDAVRPGSASGSRDGRSSDGSGAGQSSGEGSGAGAGPGGGGPGGGRSPGGGTTVSGEAQSTSSSGGAGGAGEGGSSSQQRPDEGRAASESAQPPVADASDAGIETGAAHNDGNANASAGVEGAGDGS
jgi:RNA polymerase sigma factor (sigma-70 family)